MNTLKQFSTPQLEKVHSGKVRESFRVDSKSRLIVATDRISCFDFVLDTPIPGKGAVLNSLAAYWFDATKDIIGNHLLEVVDPSISRVKEAKPITVEMIVRGYLTGSAWRGYQKGRREVSGVPIPDGMSYNEAFSTPIVTPTTKEESDREISPEGLFEEGWVAPDIFEKMRTASLALFQRGSEMLAEKGIILVDTKYEFGMVGDELVLIDEIHTPDSSRFWGKADYEKNAENVEQLDKEFVRKFLLDNKIDGEYRKSLPPEIVEETTRRYEQIFEMITGEKMNAPRYDVKTRVLQNMVQAGLIKDGYIAIVMGSPGDSDHCKKLKSLVEPYDIAAEMRVTSAHKNGERILELVEVLQNSVEPVAVLAVAGRSNGLGGALAANLAVPVISCPPFADRADLMVNLNSSIMMPSFTPNATVVDPKNAVQMALRSLNINRLRVVFADEIRAMKRELEQADAALKGI